MLIDVDIHVGYDTLADLHVPAADPAGPMWWQGWTAYADN